MKSGTVACGLSHGGITTRWFCEMLSTADSVRFAGASTEVRQGWAEFERIDVLGARETTIRPTNTAVAYGFAAAIPDRLEVTVGYGRGERSSPATSDLPITMRLAEPPAPCDLVRSA